MSRTAEQFFKNWIEKEQYENDNFPVDEVMEKYAEYYHELKNSEPTPEELKKIDYSKIDNIEFEGIDPKDHPKYCDAFIASADYNGEPMTDKQLDEINEDSDYIYEQLQTHLI